MISSSVNFPDTFPEEDYSDNEQRSDDVTLDNDRISILGHAKRFRSGRRSRVSVGSSLPYGKDDPNGHVRPEAITNGRELHDGMVPIKEEPPYSFHRSDIIHHEHPSHGYIPTEQSIGGGLGSGGESYYNRISSLSPTSTRDMPHDFQQSSSTLSCRNSLSPLQQEPMVSYELSQPKKAYYCYLCGKEYRSGTGLKQHLLAHKNEKPFGCKLCHRRYRWKGDLNRHMYTHLPNDELPLKCPECQKGFVRKDKMQLHINFAHGGGTVSNGTTEEQSKEQSPPPPFSLSVSSKVPNKEDSVAPSE